jgi:hypothetical protein
MPKPRGGVFKALPRDTRYAGIIAAASPPHHPWDTQHVTPAIADDEKALDVQRGIYRSARHAGVSAHHVRTVCTCGVLLGAIHKRRCDVPSWRVFFQLAPKEQGKQAIATHVANGGKLAYNLRRNQ